MDFIITMAKAADMMTLLTEMESAIKKVKANPTKENQGLLYHLSTIYCAKFVGETVGYDQVEKKIESISLAASVMNRQTKPENN